MNNTLGFRGTVPIIEEHQGWAGQKSRGLVTPQGLHRELSGDP